jgi:hypothetical protein
MEIGDLRELIETATVDELDTLASAYMSLPRPREDNFGKRPTPTNSAGSRRPRGS